MNIQVLGSGCSKCRITIEQIERVAQERGVSVSIEKIQDPDAIRSFGVMATPAVVVDGRVCLAGGIPGRDEIASWLS